MSMSTARENLRPRSAPAPGNLRDQDDQQRGNHFLSVNRSTTRGGPTPSRQRHEPTSSSSGSSRNDLSLPLRTRPIITSSLENGTNVNSETTASAAPSSAASTESHDPWKRKTLLTLDGGGVRGYSSLLILHAVMKEIAAIEEVESQASHSAHPLPPRPRKSVRVAPSKTTAPLSPEATVFGPSKTSHYFPSHYFDYIAGTSTGGLIAIMLGRLSMTVDECIESYEMLAGKVFGHPRLLHIRNSLWPKDKYDGKVLESVIEDIVRQREGSTIAAFPQRNENMCRTMVLAWQKRHYMRERVVYVLRSYQHHKTAEASVVERNPGRQDNFPISQVGRATSAAPFYFKAVKLDKDDPNLELIDGGFGANNPSEEAYREVGQMSNNDTSAVQLLLSLGTGRNLDPDRHHGTGWAMYHSYVNAAAKWATQSQGTHFTMQYFTQGVADYFRLNVREGLGKMKLDECKGEGGQKTLQYIRSKTEDYLRSPNVVGRVKAVARQLVAIRRARSGHRDHDHWERFCYGVDYACCAKPCHRGRERFTERQHLHNHIKNDHPDHNIDELESLLDRGKRFPLDEAHLERTPNRESD